MKKLFTLIFLCFLFVACSSDDDNKSLNGTIWVHEHEESTWKDYKKLTFGESTYSYEGYELTLSTNDTTYSSSNGSYIYNHPNVFLREKGDTLALIISGNTMTSQINNEIVYIKK